MSSPESDPVWMSSTRARLALVALLGLMLSGCTMRAWFDIDVEADGSGTFQMTVALDEELRALMEEDVEDGIDWTDPSSWGEMGDSPLSPEDLPEGAEIRPYTEEDFEGFIVAVPFGSLDEFDAMLEELSEESAQDDFPFRLTSTDGRFELSTEGEVFGSAGEGLSGEDMEMVPEEMLSSLFDIQMRASLPGEVVSHNADEVDEDGTLIWRIDPTEEDPTRPEAVSELARTSWLPWVLGAAALALAAAGLTFALRRLRRPEEVTVPGP